MEEIIAHIVQPFNLFDAAIAICTIVLSVVAIVISIITFRSQKEHNKNSVRPILNIVFGDYEDDIYVRIDNNGVGPAIIKKIECSYCTEVSKVTENSLVDLISHWKSAQENADYLSETLDYFTDFVENIKDRAIAPGHKIVLLQLTDPAYGQRIELRRFLKEVNVKISYTDIYNSKPWNCSRDADFFGRTLFDVD